MMHKHHIALILCTLPMLTWIACNRPARHNHTFHYGTCADGRYTNPFFDLEVTIPPQWHTLSEAENDGLMPNNNKPQAASKVQTALLLTATRRQKQHENDTTFNPNILLIAENLAANNRIQTPSDYLKLTRITLQQNPTPKTFPFHHTHPEEHIHGTTFARLRVINQPTTKATPKFTQDYLTTLHRGFALTYILTYRTESQRQALEQIVRTTKISTE